MDRACDGVEQGKAVARARLSDALMRTGNEDRHAFCEGYSLTSAKLFGICIRVCADLQGAENVLQNVYRTIWKRAAAWDPSRGSAITWLAAISRNEAMDWRRRRTRLPTVSIGHANLVVDFAADAHSMLQSAQLHRSLHQCLADLEPLTQDAIKTAFLEAPTHVEMARSHGVPLSTMKSRVRRGLAQMRRRLNDNNAY